MPKLLTLDLHFRGLRMDLEAMVRRSGLAERVKPLGELFEDEDGWLPQHRAAGSGDVNMVFNLCAAGVDMTVKTPSGLTPALCALLCDRSDVLCLMAKAGVVSPAKDGSVDAYLARLSSFTAAAQGDPYDHGKSAFRKMMHAEYNQHARHVISKELMKECGISPEDHDELNSMGNDASNYSLDVTFVRGTLLALVSLGSAAWLVSLTFFFSPPQLKNRIIHRTSRWTRWWTMVFSMATMTRRRFPG